MAASYNDKINQLVTQRAAEANAAVQNGTAAQTATQTSPYTGLAGVSESTQNILGQYGAGYTPSAAVTQAQKYLSDVVSGKPGAYQSGYKQQLDDLYDQVMNRTKFSYDAAGDPMYAMYRDQYMNLGRQAMMDTTAQAAALTGGYGNSYAATAGNQAYQAYLQQLNSVVPELYQMAMQQYQQEGEDLNNRYALTADLENQDYSRYQDELSQWQTERDYASSDYWNQYNADYATQQDMLNYWSQMAAQENAQYNTNRELAYNQAMAILTTGKTPSSELLEAAGISSSDAKKLAAAYKKTSGSSGSSRSSSSGSSGSSSSSTSSQQEYTPGKAATDRLYSYRSLLGSGEMLRTEVVNEVGNAVRNGYITEKDGEYILNNL